MFKNNLAEEHLDPTTEISLEAIKKRAVKGVAVLTGRTFLLNALSLAATGFLTVFLSPSEFGVFWIVSAIVNFLSYFSDVGLAAALIQKKEKIVKSELNTTFFVQQMLVIFLLLILYGVSPFLIKFYSLDKEGVILLFVLGISFLLSSLKTIPSVLLERELDFSKFVIPQVVENVVYNVVVVYFAWKGFGIRAFTYSVLARGIIGLLVMYFIKPWFPSFKISKKSLKRLLKFGVPYQLNTFLATIKDDGMTIYLGGILGSGGIGILGWAQKWAYMPLRLFMDHVLKVTFPAFSRMQDNKKSLQNSVTRSIFFVCFLVFPSVIGLLVLSPVMIEIIPRYEKWRPALIPLASVSVNSIFAASTTQLTNLLNAIGKIKTTFKLMLMWTALTWIGIPYLSIKFGVNGAAFGYALVGFSSIVAIYIIRKIVKFSLSKSIVVPLVGSLFMGMVAFLTKTLLPATFFSVWIIVVVGAVFYLMIMYFLAGKLIVNDIKRGIKAIWERG